MNKNTSIWNDTLEKIDSFPLPESQYYSDLPQIEEKNEGKITFVKTDSFSTLYILPEEKKICILNFGNPVRPALGVPRGRTQEDDLMRRSTLGKGLYINMKTLWGRPDMYPIKPKDLIYTRDVYVFKDRSGISHNPIKCDVITACVVQRPLKKDDIYLNGSDYETMKTLIENIILASICNNANILVLGSLGCDVFEYPIEETAQLLRETCQKYSGYFEEIIFPFVDERLYSTFKKIFRYTNVQNRC